MIPSLPGFGFSGPTTDRGWDIPRTARAWKELMARLGYERYGAVGNDAGSMISPELGRIDPHVIGVHVTQLFSFPSGDPAELADLTEDEQAAMAKLQWFWESMGAFNVLQSQQPQTLAHALADSPTGLLGWNGQLMVGLDDEFVVANVAVYVVHADQRLVDPLLQGDDRLDRAADRADHDARRRWPARPTTSCRSAGSRTATTRTSCAGTSTTPPATTPRTRRRTCWSRTSTRSSGRSD